MIRTALHVALTPIVILVVAVMVATRLAPAAAFFVMVGTAALGVLYGWRNRHR